MGSGNIKKFELKLGRTGLIIIICGMSILLCLSFVLGVGVGKNMDTYPEKISSVPQQVLAFFWRPARVETSQKSVESKQVQPEKGNIDLAFHNALTGDKVPAVQQPPGSGKRPDEGILENQKTKPEIPAAVASEGKDTGSSRKEATGQTPVEPEKSRSEAKSKIKETQDPVDETGPSFVIHVASMKDKAKANQIQKTVAALGYPAKVVKADIKGKGAWYRVIATGFKSKALAQSAADKISKKIKTNCIIRPDTQDAG
ncbi:MAG: SPOR domain-containing protein [Deltaproteobacteria bacterium]|nr:SPOR domain-containing protein [Deltaproteobacteria bacterium]